MSKPAYRIELRPCIRHEAEARLRQAYARLSQPMVEGKEVVALVMEKEEPEANSRPLCPGLDSESGKRSHDCKSVGSSLKPKPKSCAISLCGMLVTIRVSVT